MLSTAISIHMSPVTVDSRGNIMVHVLTVPEANMVSGVTLSG